MGVLRLLGPDQTTVLWDFDDSTGAANPSTVITNLGTALDLGTVNPALAFELREHGAALLGSPTLPTVEVNIPFTARATTDTNLWTGLGQLARYLLSASRDHPIYLDWTELSTTRYMDIVGVLEMPQLLRGQTAAGIVASRVNSLGPITLKLLRQPWMRAASVTSSGVTVPNDPATGTKVRAYPVTVTGDLPTPGKVRVQMDASAVAHRTTIAARARKSNASTYFSDYLSATGFAQAEATGRGWTVTLGTDTSGQVDATASPGSGTSLARVSYATVTATDQRVTWVRSASMDSIRGTWDVIIRVKSSATSVHEMQLRWGPRSSAGSAGFYLDAVTHDNNSPSDVSTAWVEYSLGRIQIPDTVGLSGMFLELNTSRISGTGNLDIDFIWLMPAEQQCTLKATYDALGTTIGARLATSEMMQTWPAVPAAYWLDSSGNLIHPLAVEGEVGVTLEPGDNHVFVRTESSGSANSVYGTSILAATPTVTVTYDPRYAL